MRFGIKTAPQHTTFDEMLAIWQAADQIEVYESGWNFDHFYPLVGDTDGPCLEAWVTLTALAARTKRLRVGSMVCGAPYRHPSLIANMAASLDIVSGGRLELGLGAGWYQKECDAYGVDLLPLRQRMDRFEESVEAVVSLLSQEETTFKGQFYQLEAARCEPKGPQRPHPPIVIGGGGEKRTLRTAARFAQHWNLPFATPEIFGAKNEILRKHCADVGRDEHEITRSVQLAFQPDDDPAEAAAKASALGEAGVDLVIWTLRTPYRVEVVEPLARALEPLS